MARNSIQLYADNSSDANFRAWVAEIVNILTAGGFTQTADTGQTDFTTASKPTSLNQVVGYQVWESVAITGLNKYLIKIEFGAGGGSVNRPSIWITVGWASNGSGTLTGNISVRQQIQSATNSSVTQYDSNLWSNGDAVCVALFVGHTGTSYIIFNVERVRDKTGAKQDKLFIWANAGAGGANYCVPRTGTVPTGTTTTTVGQRNVPPTQAQLDSNYGISTIAPCGGSFLIEAGNIFGADTTNFTGAQSVHEVEVFGETRNYILSNLSSAWATGYRILTRYDV